MPGIYRRKLENVAKEGAVGFCVGGVENNVGAINHSGLRFQEHGRVLRWSSQGSRLRLAFAFVESHFHKERKEVTPDNG